NPGAESSNNLLMLDSTKTLEQNLDDDPGFAEVVKHHADNPGDKDRLLIIHGSAYSILTEEQKKKKTNQSQKQDIQMKNGVIESKLYIDPKNKPKALSEIYQGFLGYQKKDVGP